MSICTKITSTLISNEFKDQICKRFEEKKLFCLQIRPICNKDHLSLTTSCTIKVVAELLYVRPSSENP